MAKSKGQSTDYLFEMFISVINKIGFELLASYLVFKFNIQLADNLWKV